jgi:hypothetical protein
MVAAQFGHSNWRMGRTRHSMLWKPNVVSTLFLHDLLSLSPLVANEDRRPREQEWLRPLDRATAPHVAPRSEPLCGRGMLAISFP